VPLVVVDTSVSLPATLSEPGGLARKFMVLLAYGALTYREEHLNLELSELEQELVRSGGEIRGAEALRSMQETAADRRSALAELLPYGTPADWVAAGSATLFDEYLRKVREKAPVFGLDIDEAGAFARLARLQAICVYAAKPFDLTKVPAFTADPKDDPIVYSAFRAGADLIVSDDKHIVPKAERPVVFYEHEDETVAAMTFDHLIHDKLSDVDWGQIDGRWLVEAFR
jgi:predicted nucleic acid-binding protein